MILMILFNAMFANKTFLSHDYKGTLDQVL